MAKNSPRRSLRSLFSKREVNVDDPAKKAADQNEGEKKRFKFLKFRTKPKNESGPVKPVHENQQLLSGAEPNNTAEEGGTWADNISDNIASDNKFSLYGTAPRSKLSILPSTSSKELSYSELDLRKPKRISSFSFGFRRKKKNDDEESISRSTAVLHRPGSEEPKQTPLRLSQMELDKDNTKMTISMSQPQLDISKKFDIPSPPPLATNQLDSSFTLLNQSGSNVNIDTQQEVKEPLTNGSALSDEHEEPQKAPIATIPELQLDSLDSSEEKETIPVHENFNKSDTTTLTEITSVVNNQTESIFTASQPSIVPDTSDDRVAVADSVITNNGVCDEDILQQSHTKIEISLTETTRDILSHHQPDVPDTAGSETQNGEVSVPNTDSKIDTTITDSTPVPLADNSALSANSASVHQEVSISHTVPETAISVTTTSSVSKEKSTCPVSQETVYEALYDSLLPQSFTSEVLSSLSKPLPQIHTEIRHQEVSVSCTDGSVPETATSVTTTSSVSKEKSTIPANQDKVYGAQYDSLLPQSVASMEVSTLSSPPPQINTKIRQQEISISCTDGSVPETATSVRTTSSVCEEKNTNYGASYDSLLPQSFTSVEESSLSNPPPQFSTEIRRQEVSTACTDGSVPKTATSVTTTSSVSEERSARSVSQATIYGALYNSLLPQSFTSGLVSAPSNPPPKISTEIREVSVSCNDGFVPQTATSVTTTSSVSEEKSTHPVSQDKNNGASYDPLLPQSFALEVVSPTSNPPPQISTEIGHESTRSGPIMVKTLNEHHTETNVIYSRLSTSKDSSPHRTDDAVGGYMNRNSSVSEIKGVPATSRFNPTSFQPQQNTEIYSRYLLSCPISDYKPADSGSICYSELTRSLSEVKSDSSSLIQDNVRSVSVVESPAPPASDDVTSQEADAQVTDSKRRVILVKELVTDEASADPVSPSPVPEKMSESKGLKIRIETKESFSTPTGPTNGSDGPLSPTYLSVGSDDGSAMEIYYSAEEDNTEESPHVEVYKVDERAKSPVVDVVKEAWLHEELPHQGEITESRIKKRDEGEFRVLIVKMQSEDGKMGNDEEKEDLNSRTEVQVRGQRSEDQVQEIKMSDFLVGNDAKTQEKDEAATVLPQVKEGKEEEERKEELPATPVQQVNTRMVCDLAPPSNEPHGQGEGSAGNGTTKLETEDPPNGEKQLASQEIQYMSHKDIMISEYMQAVSSNTGEENVITPRFREADEQVSPTAAAQKIVEVSTETSSVTTASAVTDPSSGVEVVTDTLTHSAELQSNATQIEHNRAPQSSEWVDTITESTDRTRTVQEQVAVELSAQNVDTHLPDTKAAETLSERQEHPAEAQPDLTQGSLAESRTPTAASEVFASENKVTAANKESVDEMSSGYSNLSTKLYMKTSSPPKENESKSRFRKVSLVNHTDTKEVVDTADISKTGTTVTESNGTDISSDFKWKNRFEAVAQYRPYKNDFSSFTDSLSYRVSDTDTSPPSSSSFSSSSFSSSSFSSYSSAVPEATAYKHLSNAFSSPSSTPPPDEHITLGNQLSDSTKVYLSHESEPAGAPRDEWRRSLVEQEEPAAPAGEREKQRVAESERIKSRWESQELPVSSLSTSKQTSYDVVDSFKKEDDDDATLFTGVFKATLVELVSEPAAPPSTPPASPEADSPNQSDMDSLVDTLKSMGPSLRPRAGLGPRPPAPVLISSLPPIVEDAPSPITADIPGILSPTKKMEAISNPAESLKPLYTLPADIGLKKNNNRDNRSPLELMKHNQQDQQQPGKGGLNLPLRASTANSLVMRKSSDSSPEEVKSPVLNGNGLLQSSITGSRLDNSVIFGNHRSASIDQPLENGKAHRSLFRTASLPETGLSNDRMSMGPKELSELGTKTDLAGSRFERLSFLLNSPPSSGSLPGSEDSNARMSRPPLMGIGSPPAINSPTRLLSPTGSIDLQRPFTTTDSPLSVFGQTQGLGMGAGTGVLSTPILQRSFSSEGTVGVQPTSLFNSLHGGFQSQEVETERNLATKYRAFPDAYLTKEKEHGKLNPRPGKMYIFDQPGMCGQRIEVRSDVIDATPWELKETISIRVIRGGWVLYEKPNFKGEKIALDEGDIEITYPFSPPEEQLQNGQQGKKQNGEQNGEEGDAQTKTKPARRFIIGSLRRAVRDYSVPEIGLFPEENAEGKKVTFRDTSDDARIFGFPIKANSIIINAGLWLVYAHPFFQGVPRVLEVGGYSNPAAWGVEQPYVGSLHPLKIGEPRVENTSEPKMVIYDKPYFSGKSRTITTNMRDFMTRVDRQQTAFMYNVGSIKVLGGIWAGYEKEGFRGHQYLLEEGEYQDWRVWGGRDAELRSARVIRADLTDPVMVMFEQPEEDQEGMQEENTFEVTEAIPDVELFGYKTSTRSIHVLSGAWIAYSHVDFSGNQYILEKGFYNNCADWGSQDTRICSVQPILLAPGDSTRSRHEIILYSEPDFHGECHVFDRNQKAIPEKLKTKSCRVAGGSWVIYEDEQYSGNLYVLSEGEYPNLTSMACPPDCIIRSVKVVPMKFSVPSISLFGLECLEGREITMDTEIPNMVEEGFNNHILSVRVNSGCWVICEHSNYRGRQFLLEPIEITNWLKFSSLQTIGSMFPVRQKRRYLRIKNTERGHFMSVQGGVEEMKSGRVVVTPEVEPMSDIWFYQDGLIKSKLAPNMSLQVMGNIEPGAKVVLWTETRQPIQTWAAQMRGLITSLTFPGCVLDVKGGKTYDKDHVVMMPENEERPSQQWEIEVL